MIRLVALSIISLIPASFLVLFLVKLINWFRLTIFYSKSSASLDLSAYGGNGRSKRAWALITGASDGIGAAFAKELARQEFNLFLVGRNLDKLERVKNEILKENQIKIVCLISEASNYENACNLFKEIDEYLLNFTSGNRIRILINNVGIGQNGKRRLGEIEVCGDEGKLFDEIVGVNCIYPILLTREYLKRCTSSNSGRCAIINISSCAALTPATPFSSLYAASKSFNRSFSLSLSGELAAKNLLHPDLMPVVDVVCVNPGFVVSNMTKMRESWYCCTAEQHAQVVFSKISSAWPFGSTVDIIPHWKHGLMWSFLAFLEFIIPSEWFLVAIVMPAVLKYSGRFRNFKIKE